MLAQSPSARHFFCIRTRPWAGVTAAIDVRLRAVLPVIGALVGNTLRTDGVARVAQAVGVDAARLAQPRHLGVGFSVPARRPCLGVAGRAVARGGIHLGVRPYARLGVAERAVAGGRVHLGVGPHARFGVARRGVAGSGVHFGVGPHTRFGVVGRSTATRSGAASRARTAVAIRSPAAARRGHRCVIAPCFVAPEAWVGGASAARRNEEGPLRIRW